MTPKKTIPATIEYIPGNEHKQGLLRLALFEAWNGRCHWCRLARPDATYIEIDHILPESRYARLTHALSKEDRKAYTKKHLALVEALPLSPHDVRNLAPICAAGRRCNQEKTDAIDTLTFGAIRTSLKRASKKASKVTRRIRRMLDAQGLEQHLVSMIGMPINDETRRLVERYGQFVLRSIHQVDAPAFDRFRTPAEILLDVDLGMVPDFFSEATRTGSGVDGLLYLSDNERIALSAARVLFDVDAGTVLADAVNHSVREIDSEVEAELGVNYPELEGPRWLRVVDQTLEPGEHPTFELKLEMTATYGGESIEDTDSDGNPRTEHRSISVQSEILCTLDFAQGSVEPTWTWCITDRE